MPTIINNEIRTGEAWTAMIASFNSGARTEVSQAEFDYFLNVLPPRWMSRTVNTADGPRHAAFGMGEGSDPTLAFWKEGEAYFAQQVQ